MSLRFLVTGGAGFIGSNFVRKQILETDNSILNLDKLTYAGNLENLSEIESSSRYQFVEGDITDSALIAKILKDFQPMGQ